MDLRNKIKSDVALSEFLNATRKEMYDSLSLFHNHVKFTISLLLSLITAIFAVFGFFLKDNENLSEMIGLIRTIGSIIFVTIFLIGIISMFIIGRYYKLYAASLMYAEEAHKSVGLENHFWFIGVEEIEKKLSKRSTKKDLLNRRTNGITHSLFLYRVLIMIISTGSLIISIYLMTYI